MKQKRSHNFPLVLSSDGRGQIDKMAQETGRRRADIIREALHLYFLARGQDVDFDPGKPGVHKSKG